MAKLVQTPSIACAIILSMVAMKESRAQEVDEVMLTFAFPAVGQVYVNAAFKGDRSYIGVGELLNLLAIPYKYDQGAMGFWGAYPGPKDRWEINTVNLYTFYKGEKRALKPDQFYKSETDVMLSPELYKEIFGIDMTVNAFGLVLSITSERTLPVEELRKREKLRAQLKQSAPENPLIQYPMLYPRERKPISLGMFDYNLVYGRTDSKNEYGFIFGLGGEAFGGDFQTYLSGTSFSSGRTLNAGGSRWRYVFDKGIDPNGNSMISELALGQIPINGPLGGRLYGVSLSNTPIVPRRVLDVFAIEGFTQPDSEVELLIAGQLTDFTRADELGYYRFTTPLTYGTIRIQIRIYTPQGEVIFENRELQIPFTFVPRGIFNYNVQLGYGGNSLSTMDSVLSGNADVALGITNNFTLRTGLTQFVDSSGLIRRLPYGSANVRVFDQYLVNFEVQQNRLMQANASVFYANNSTINAQYIRFVGLTDLNRRGEREIYTVNYFLPFTIKNQGAGLRFSFDRLGFSDRAQYQYQVDFNTRFGPVISRINYREGLERRSEGSNDINRLATASLTYNIPRLPGVPAIVRGMFIRAQLRHDMKRFDASALGSIQFSQTIAKNGRLTINYDRDFAVKGNVFQIGFLYDFSGLRSSSRVTVRQEGRQLASNFAQAFTGSVGADLSNGIVVPTNRDQVGRAGVSVRLFVDANANGILDKGEEIVPAKAVRLDQSATILLSRDGTLQITQLQNYWTYRLSVDVNALPDPTLAPVKSKFSFVADPNQYKLIDIPLYRTGTIEGFVYNENESGAQVPQPGVRLYAYLEGSDDPIPTIRSFSDGAFYANGLIPGNYIMLVDSNQLKFMNKIQLPDTLRFTIRATAEGDWIDTLKIILKSKPADSTKANEPMTLAQLESLLGQKLRTAIKAFSEAQEKFYRGKLDEALIMTDSSLREYPSDFAIAMRGSILFMQGDKTAAVNLWAEARERNPFVIIPDTSRLKLKTELKLPDEVVQIPVAPSPADSITLANEALVAQLESELGQSLRNSVAYFVAAQEEFYSLDFESALSHIDSSLSYNRTDHALALKGSVVYVLGRKSEAWQFWYEARERNPMITLPDTEILDRLMTPVAEIPQRNARKKLISNR